MSKNTSRLFKPSGNLDGITFFQKDGDHFMRLTPLSNKNKFLNDPGMARVRENANEFKIVAEANKTIIDVLRPIIMFSKDSTMHIRMNKLMHELKKTDLTSNRGQRSPLIALNNAESKLVLKGFDFNEKAPMSSILIKPFELDSTMGTLVIEDFNPLIHLVAESSATHFSLTMGKADMDPFSGKSELVMSNVFESTVNAAPSNITLQLESETTINGLLMFVMQIAFFQEMNGQLYPLKDKAHNASKIIEVL